MAVADTANLIVNLRLDDKFSGPLRNANRSLSGFQQSAFTLGKGIGQVGAGVGKIAVNLVKLGAAGAIAFGAFVGANLRAGIDSLHELELQVAATDAALISTKGVSGQTAESVRKLAEQYENLNATIDDKVIQSAENLLLTFPKITSKAFEPALEAALNLSTALGGGEEGLQSAIIQVGKALQDPIRGVTALRRVGVSLTVEQEKQIKTLVEQNDLYGAQQIILKELAVEFGGRFAAAGDTAAGRIAHLHDNVEELQKTLAGPFAGEGGVIDRVVGKLGDFLGETGTVNAVQRFGDAIAGLFTDEGIERGIGLLRSGLELLSPENLGKVGAAASKAFDFVKKIDFATLGNVLSVTARVAKTAVDAFLSLPPGVQSVVIAALAANKLSGGLVGSGLGNIAKGLGGLLTGGGLLGRGSSAANPLWVQSVIGGAGSAPGLIGGAGLVIKSLLGVTAAVTLGALLGNEIGRSLFFDKTVAPAKEYERDQFAGAGGKSTETLKAGLAEIDDSLHNLKVDILPGGLGQVLFGKEIDELEGQRTKLQGLIDQRERIDHADSARWTGLANSIGRQQLAEATASAAVAARVEAHRRSNEAWSARLAALAGTGNVNTAAIAAKKFTFSAALYTTVNARLSVASALSTQRIYTRILSDNNEFF